MKLEDQKKQIDDFFDSHTQEQLKEKWEKYSYLSEPIYDVISTIGQNLEYEDFEDN